MNLFFTVLNFHNLIWQFQLLTARGKPRTGFKSNINWYHFLFTPAKYSAPLWSENSKKGPLWEFYESAIKSRELGRVPVKGTREQSRSSQKYLDSNICISVNPHSPNTWGPALTSTTCSSLTFLYWCIKCNQSFCCESIYYVLRLYHPSTHLYLDIHGQSSQSRAITFLATDVISTRAFKHVGGRHCKQWCFLGRIVWSALECHKRLYFTC